MIKKISLYWHTLRYLRLRQIYERLKLSLPHQAPDLSPAPELRPGFGLWNTPVQHAPSLIGPEEFIFIGVRGSLPIIGWNGADRDKLWRYNQHYFDDLNASYASSRHEWHLAILKKWVDQNPPGAEVGWESYPTSLRIVNWIKWSLSGNVLPLICIQSLAVQARFLSNRLERHLLGNHLLANAKALVFAGIFFQGIEADGWLQKGIQIIDRELEEQILQDGGHFERSTMYQSIVLEDFLDLVKISQFFPELFASSAIMKWRFTAMKMCIWLTAMTHPDNQISFFNDAAFNISATPQDLLTYANSLEIETKFNYEHKLAVYELIESGYIRLSSNSAVAFLDVAPIGPDYLPGHAHADTLSFELSLYSQRIIVNGGTSLYGVSEERSQQRETRSHSTVEIDGQSSSEVWGGFRVARRANPFGLKIDATDGKISVGCSHDGYIRLKGRPIHHRKWIMTKNKFTVSDWVTGGNVRSLSRFILHPSVSVKRLNTSEWSLCTRLSQEILFRVVAGVSFIESSIYAPEFGVDVPTKCLVIELTSGRSEAIFEWN